MRQLDVEKRAKEIWKAPYTCIVVREGADGFSAKVLEFPGCFAEGDTAAEAHANLEDAAIAWIQDQLDKGEAIPSPQPEPEYSGRFLLRFQRSLHARAARQAAIDNVSLNQFIATAVAEKLACTSGTSVKNAAPVTYAVAWPTFYLTNVNVNMFPWSQLDTQMPRITAATSENVRTMAGEQVLHG